MPGYGTSDEGETIKTLTGDYHMLDVTVSKLFLKDRFSFAMGCKNIFDVRNINRVGSSGAAHSGSSSSIPLSTGRNYFIKLALNFSKA